jgi:hypothetical protein
MRPRMRERVKMLALCRRFCVFIPRVGESREKRDLHRGR